MTVRYGMMEETAGNITAKPTEETDFIEKEPAAPSLEQSFILNKNTKKYHREDCRFVGFMNEENKIFVNSTPEKLQEQSYEPCYFCQ